MKEEEQLKKKIKEIEAIILTTKINPTNYDFIDKCLDILRKLWDQLYFKIHQEKNYLIK